MLCARVWVLLGHCRLTGHRVPRHIANVGPGEIIGEHNILKTVPAIADVKARTTELGRAGFHGSWSGHCLRSAQQRRGGLDGLRVFVGSGRRQCRVRSPAESVRALRDSEVSPMRCAGGHQAWLRSAIGSTTEGYFGRASRGPRKDADCPAPTWGVFADLVMGNRP